MSETNAEDAGYSTNRKFRRAVGRVLIALSFKTRQKSERFQGDDCEDVTKTSDRNPTEVTDDQPSRKNYDQPETVFALKDSTEMKSEKSIEEPTEEEFIKSSASYSREMSVTPPKGLGFSYPGDLLSEGRPRQTTPVRRVIPPPLIKRNTIADFVSNRGFQTAVTTLSASSPGTDQEKKTKSTFSLLKLIDKKSNRSKENLSQLNDVLQNLEQSEFVDHGLALYKV